MLLYTVSLCVLTMVAAQDGGVVSYEGYQLLRVYPSTAQQLGTLMDLVRRRRYEGLVSLWSQQLFASRTSANNRTEQSADLLSAPQVLEDLVEQLDANGISYDVLIHNLEEAIQSENPPIDPENDELESRGGHRLTWRRYHRYKDIDSYIEYLAITYPDICQTEVIGKSSQGRDLKLLKVSTGGDGNKPAIWIDGGLHAREWISPATVTYIMLQLVEFRDLHPELIDSVDWYIMPVANPDGYEYSHSTDRLWRKTRSGAKANKRWGKRTCYGVDPNRNWDFHWGEDRSSSSDACTDDFRGPKAFSEPETKAMADFILTRKDQIKIYLTLHSYSQMWLVPWGYKNDKPKGYYDMYILAEKGVEALEAVRGTDYLLGTAAELLYTASGASDDWAKGVAGIKYSYTIELPDTGSHGFVLPAHEIEPVGQETWAAVKAITRHFTDARVP
ncbi:Carboxypeptidase B [Zootermopsis nevadensis]|uniref:Carboxypeptidase B n=2 Tax=Zootermopsis nevadensis TaxID=136037 RepID=A0A067RCR6_ZOONE|nr:Carboxypeptidase B [Zootermopsis nevadensis]